MIIIGNAYILVHLGKAKKPCRQCLVLNANGLKSNVSLSTLCFHFYNMEFKSVGRIGEDIRPYGLHHQKGPSSCLSILAMHLVHLGKAKTSYRQCLVLNANGLTLNASFMTF